jgi:hypothetical protein
MNIDDIVIDEIGQHLISNNLFVDKLANRLAERLKPETILSLDNTELGMKVKEKRKFKNTRYYTFVNIFDLYNKEELIEIFYYLLTLSPFKKEDWFTYDALRLMLNTMSIEILASVLCTFNFLEMNSEGLIEVKTDRLYRPDIKGQKICLKVPNLNKYQKLISKDFKRLMEDRDEFIKGNNNIFTVEYIDFLDFASELPIQRLQNLNVRLNDF